MRGFEKFDPEIGPPGPAPGLFSEVGEGADFERIVVVQDRASGLRALIVLHSLRRGPAFGGVRRVVYGSEHAALADAKRLAASMTAKCALAGLPAGGGKTVMMDHPGLDARVAYRVLGGAIEMLGGSYVCGPDVGTDDVAMELLRGETRHANPRGNDAGASTAAGVLAGLRGLLRVLVGHERFGQRRYIVQGLGAVGMKIAAALVEAGGEVLGYDIDPDVCARAETIGVRMLDSAALLVTPCDIFVPCALGGIIDVDVAKVAPWRGVCGSANNQLASAHAGEVLRERDILWAPDVIVNAGAVIEGVMTVGSIERPQSSAATAVAEAISAIARTCEDVLREAVTCGATPDEVARARVRLRV